MAWRKFGVRGLHRMRVRHRLFGSVASEVSGTGRRKPRRIRANMMADDPRCWYCGIEVVETTREPRPPNAATVEHLFHRLKGRPARGRLVLACNECNNERNRYSERLLGIEALHQRGQIPASELIGPHRAECACDGCGRGKPRSGRKPAERVEPAPQRITEEDQMGNRRAAAVARANSSKAKWSRVRFRDNREPSTRELAIGGGDCWCGQPSGHQWPGKATGAPHPRKEDRPA